MIYEMLLALVTLQTVAESDASEKRVAKTEIKRQVDWPVGCWNCRSWGAIRLLDDHYAIDTDPEGRLNNWGIWQYYCSDDAVIIVWMESSYDEVIQKNNDKYFMQSLWRGDMSSKVEEVKKVGK